MGVKPRTRTASSSSPETTPKLLSSGNPQIAKADGPAPVAAYIAAMPGWKRDVGRAVDALVVDAVPNVRKAVRWNSPFYGLEGRGWFVSMYCYQHYVKLTFLNGAHLDPPPPVGSKHPDVRYLKIREGEPLSSALDGWIRQAAALPGEPLF